MIQTTELTYQYPKSNKLNFPDFYVKEGDSLLVCGESGCGKTTLLHLLAGLRKPTGGEVMVEDEDISKFSATKMDHFRGRHIGIVYQQSYFIQSLSVLDNLLISPYANDKEKAKIVADRLEIGDLLSRYPNQLSVGQQQRLSIARSVMNEPKFLLADEPTSALDNKNCSKVINLLIEEATNHQAALIIVTHDDRLKKEVSDCIELNPLKME
ncbi:MAG: ATP-binding cassette domain-containing protein [Flavobacteriales bacterium]|nr:ATP-binding cassette domain-containing protein [Flavobacteriales bacterium]